MLQNLYKITFWAGYTATLIVAFIPLTWELDKIKIGPGAFKIRLDHLLHLSAYFLICMYYLAGQAKDLKLFKARALQKFILVTLVLATVTEFVQFWVPARAFNLFDWLANVSGIGIGLVVIIKIKDSRWKIKERRMLMLAEGILPQGFLRDSGRWKILNRER